MIISLAALVIFLLTTTTVGAVDVPDSGLVRIRLDQDNATILLDGSVQLFDRQGNAPVKDVWFVLTLAPGAHRLNLSKAGYTAIEQSVIVVSNEIATIDVSFQPETAIDSSAANLLPIDSTKPDEVRVSADPPGAELRIDEAEQTLPMPARLTLAAGDYTLVVSAGGYEELAHQLQLPPGEIISLSFLLRENEPFPLSGEELGLERRKEIPLIDEKMADRLRQRFYGLAETFAIIPFAQGIIARLIVGENGKKEANVLIIAGASLTGGSYLLGRILSSRKRAQIISHNERAAQENAEVKGHNKEIDRIVREKNAEALSEWEVKNRNRGRVKIEDK